MKQNPYIRSWLLMLFSILAITSKAQTVNISWKTPFCNYQGYPCFLVSSGSIELRSSAGQFDSVLIDDIEKAYTYRDYWYWYTINISEYCDGLPHKLQLMRGNTNCGICYITSSKNILESISINGIDYCIDNDNAIVVNIEPEIENLKIPETIEIDGTTYPVTAIGPYAFYKETNLSSVSIPNSVTSIGNSAFEGCTGLLFSVTIPNSVTLIGDSAFNGCSGLTSMTIPQGVTNIGTRAFYNTGLTVLEFNAQNCITCGAERYPAFPPTILTITIGENVTSIPAYFLNNNEGVESLTIPNSVTSIGEYAFASCTNLKEIDIPEGIQTIEEHGFAYCRSLEEIIIPSSVLDIKEYAFYDCPSVKRLVFCDSSNILTIGVDSFCHVGASEIYIGRDIKNKPDWGSNSNEWCWYGLSDIKPQHLVIGPLTTNLKAITGYYKHRDVEGTYYGNQFDKLETIVCYALNPPEMNSVFSHTNYISATIKIPKNQMELYKNANIWKNFWNIEEMDAILVAELRLNLTEVILGVGETVQLSVEVLPTNATNKAVEWISSDESVVTVDESGLTKALSEGTATITIRSVDGNSEVTCSIAVQGSARVVGIYTDDNEIVEIYNLNGYKVSDSADNLAPGIYIVRQGLTTYKIIVR